MDKKLKVGVIGTGFIGKQHIEAIRRIPGTEVCAIADSNLNMAKSVSEQLFIQNYYQDYKEMLKDEVIDIIHNCTPSAMHYVINKDVIASGKHIYCDKPFTLTSTESEELITLAFEKGVAAGVNFNYRNNVMVHEMHERIKNGNIGKVLMIHGEYLQDWLLYETDYDWRMDPKIGGKSRAIADIGSHCFDTIQYVIGKKIISVYAKLMTMYPVRKHMEKTDTFSGNNGKVIDEIPIESEDAAFIMVKFEDGILGLFNISQVCAGKKNGLMINVSGSEASLEWKQENADKLFVGHRDVGNEDIYADAKYLTSYAKKYATLPNGHSVGWADAFRNGIASFYESVRNESYMEKEQVYATFDNAHRIMKIVEACLKSNEVGHWINID